MKPKVSILCVTFNQSKFIKQTLDGFLRQKTNFPFEIIIHDDASTDGTTEIVRSYVKKYPDIIKPTYEKENQYSQRNFEFIKDMYVTHAQGQYIATCEGDDYWTDANKLQMQVDFLDKNLDFAVCFHPTRVVFENSDEKDSIFPKVRNTDQFTVENLIITNFMQTSSVLYRKKKDYKDMFADAMPGDWYTHLYHAQQGKIGFINKVMSVYRRHDGGVWWTAHNKKDEFWIRYGVAHIQTYNEIYRIYGQQYSRAIYRAVSNIYDAIFNMSDVEKSHQVILDSMQQYPDMIKGAYLSYQERLNAVSQFAEKEQKDILSLHKDILKKDEYIHNLEAQISNIHNTKLWQVVRRLNAYKKKITKK